MSAIDDSGRDQRASDGVGIDAQVAEWRHYLLHRQSIAPADVDELEDHLRGQMGALRNAGLAADEAFLIGVKRLGDVDSLAREFAREHAERLWKQLGPGGEAADGIRRRETAVVIILAVTAGLLIKVPELFGQHLLGADPGF